MRDEVTAGFPDTRAFVFQGNLFGGFGSNRNIAVHMQSSDVEALLEDGDIFVTLGAGSIGAWAVEFLAKHPAAEKSS